MSSTDTLRTAETLAAAGVPERQAAAHARAIDEATEHLVTQEYLDARLAELETRLTRTLYRAMLIQAGVIVGAVVALLRLIP